MAGRGIRGAVRRRQQRLPLRHRDGLRARGPHLQAHPELRHDQAFHGRPAALATWLRPTSEQTKRRRKTRRQRWNEEEDHTRRVLWNTSTYAADGEQQRVDATRGAWHKQTVLCFVFGIDFLQLEHAQSESAGFRGTARKILTVGPPQCSYGLATALSGPGALHGSTEPEATTNSTAARARCARCTRLSKS